MATDSIATTHAPNTAAPPAAAKESPFALVNAELGNHHEVNFSPIGELPLPYIIWDNGSFHVFGSTDAVMKSGQYRVDTNSVTQTSPITEKAQILHKDGTPVGLDLSITSNLFFVVFGAVALFIILKIAAANTKKSLVPSGLRNLVEVLIVFVRDDIVVPNLPEPYATTLMPYHLTVFFFIFIAGLVGILPWAHTSTSSLEVTAGMALCTFAITQYVGIREMGIKVYLKHFTAGLLDMELSPVLKAFFLIIMIPIEIMSMLTKPFALAIRLFANMTAGHVIIFSLIGLVFLFHSIVVGAVLAVPFSVFVFLLEIFEAALQAYIFAILSALFIGMMAHSEEEEHVQDHDMAHAPNGDHVIATAHGM